MKGKKLTGKQRDLLSETIVDVGKLVFAALALAQAFSERPLNAYLFALGILFLILCVVVGIFISK
jgi:hypothetical protein